MLLSSLFLNELFCFVNSTSIKTSFLEHGHRPVQSDSGKEHLDIVLNENSKSQEKKIFISKIAFVNFTETKIWASAHTQGTGGEKATQQAAALPEEGSRGFSCSAYFHIVSFNKAGGMLQ